MAIVTRVHGDAHPVFASDISNGKQTGALSADALVQMAGPKMDFFAIVVKNSSAAAQDIDADLDTGESVEAILRAVQQLGVISMYQVEQGTTGQISLAVYPAGAWTAATLETAVRALGSSVGSNGIDVSGSTVTNAGFKLATS